MPKFKVPLRVSVAPVQTYAKTITVEAASREEAEKIIRQIIDPGNMVLVDAINSVGWKPVCRRLGQIQPHLTAYDTYLDERALAEWARGFGAHEI